MNDLIKKIARYLIRLVVSLFTIIACYFIVAVFCSCFPIRFNKYEPNPQGEYFIFIRTNGVHTDLTFPVSNDQFNWADHVSLQNIPEPDSALQFISLGWGDRAFYTQTPNWSDLKFITAFKAVFYLGTSAMHVQYHYDIVEDNECKRVRLDKKTYKKLAELVLVQFAKNKNGNLLTISSVHYNKRDVFYEAIGTFGFFHTCNSWTNRTLKKANLPGAWWTPFDFGIMRYY